MARLEMLHSQDGGQGDGGHGSLSEGNRRQRGWGWNEQGEPVAGLSEVLGQTGLQQVIEGERDEDMVPPLLMQAAQ